MVGGWVSWWACVCVFTYLVRKRHTESPMSGVVSRWVLGLIDESINCEKS